MFTPEEYERTVGRLYMEGMAVQKAFERIQSQIFEKDREIKQLSTRLDERLSQQVDDK